MLVVVCRPFRFALAVEVALSRTKWEAFRTSLIRQIKPVISLVYLVSDV